MSLSGLRLEVLLVDDDPVIRKSYGNQLRGEGWSVTVAADGYEALQAAQDAEFDVVLLDLRMPYRNGADVLRSLRARPEFANTAVLLLAQPGDADLVDRAMREGADGVFEKARITPRDCVHEIHDLFTAGGRKARNAGQQPAAQGAQPVAAAPTVAAAPVVTNVPAAVDDIARRFRKGATRAGATTTTNYSKDPEAAARAVAARVTQRQLTERDRGPPLSTRWMPTLEDESREVSAAPAAAMPPAPPVEEPASPPASSSNAPAQTFSTVLNRMVGESGKLATALGLPTDYLCPVCRQQIALRLWPDPEMEAGVRGHFYCPRCTGR